MTSWWQDLFVVSNVVHAHHSVQRYECFSTLSFYIYCILCSFFWVDGVYSSYLSELIIYCDTIVNGLRSLVKGLLYKHYKLGYICRKPIDWNSIKKWTENRVSWNTRTLMLVSYYCESLYAQIYFETSSWKYS